MRSSTLLRLAVCVALLCSIVVVSPPGVAEATGSSWRWLSPTPRGETLNAMDLVTADIGYAVGNMGCLMKTYDGGANWISKSSGTSEDLHAVAFVDADTGWVGGDGGFIAKTDGSSGATWTRQVTGVTDGRITGLFFRDANRGWAVDDSARVFRTVNGGATWEHSTVPGADFSAVYFVSDAIGFASTRMQNRLYTSINGGVDWTLVQDFGAPITDVVFEPGSTQVGWITLWRASPSASAYRTGDGGITWDPVTIASGNNAYLEGAAFTPDGSALWMVGDDQQPRRIYKVTDSATPAVTEVQYAPDWQDFPLNDVDCVSANEVLAVGMFGAVARTDDGSTFADRARVLPRQEINAIQFLDLRTGYIAGSDGTVYKSTDAGKSWTATPTGVNEPLLSAQFIDRNTGWAVGFSGTIIKTINGGTSWATQTSGTTQVLQSVCFVDANNGWAAGENGTMLHTTNGGTTWVPQTDADFTTAAILDVDFFNANEGAAVGYDRVIYTTTDGGADWTRRVYGAFPGMAWYDVEYVAPDTFFLGGDYTDLPSIGFSMLKTINGGDSFALAPSVQSTGSDWKSHGSAYDMVFTDANNGWVAFMDGTIASTTDGGSVWTYEKAADEEIRELGVVNAGAVWAGGPLGRLLSNYSYSPKTVYRFYRPSTGTHFYTADVNEKHYIINNLSSIYTFEGTGYVYDDYYASQPLYRFYRPATGTHFFTADPEERDNVINKLGGVFTYEGPVYNISSTPMPGALTVYRFYRPKSGSHFYTADPAERDHVISTLGGVFSYEGPVYYLPQ